MPQDAASTILAKAGVRQLSAGNRLLKKAGLPLQSTFGQEVEDFARQFYGGAVSTLAGAVELPASIDRLIGGTPEENPAYLPTGLSARLANAMRGHARSVEEGGPEEARGGASSLLGGAAGSSLGFLGPGLVAKGALEGAGLADTLMFGKKAVSGIQSIVGTALVGAQVNAADAYHEALDSGGTPEQAMTAYLANLPVGALEAAGVEAPATGRLARLLAHVDASSGGAVRHLLMETGQEAFTEGGQQALGNLIAAHVAKYDEDRAILEGVPEAMLGGAFGGALFSATTQLAEHEIGGRRRQRATIEALAAARDVEVAASVAGRGAEPGGAPIEVEEADRPAVAEFLKKNAVEPHPADVGAVVARKPEVDAQKFAAQLAAKLGKRAVFIDTGAARDTPALFHGDTIVFDARAEPGVLGRATARHEAIHAMPVAERSALLQKLQDLLPEDLKRAEENYAADAGRTLEKGEGTEEGQARLVEELDALIDFVEREPEAIENLLVKDRTVLQRIADPVLEGLQKAGLPVQSSSARRLRSLVAAVSTADRTFTASPVRTLEAARAIRDAFQRAFAEVAAVSSGGEASRPYEEIGLADALAAGRGPKLPTARGALAAEAPRGTAETGTGAAAAAAVEAQAPLPDLTDRQKQELRSIASDILAAGDDAAREEARKRLESFRQAIEQQTARARPRGPRGRFLPRLSEDARLALRTALLTEEHRLATNRAAEVAESDRQETARRLREIGLTYSREAVRRRGFKLTPEQAKLVEKFRKGALREGEKTEIGRTQPVASRTTSKKLRAQERATRELREQVQGASEERVAIKEQAAKARAEIERDKAGTESHVFAKIERGDALDAWETVAADILSRNAETFSLKTGSREDVERAIAKRWLYFEARRETARALGVVRDPFPKTEREVIADALAQVSRPNRFRYKQATKALAKAKTEKARFAARSRLNDIAKSEARNVEKIRRALAKMGIDLATMSDDQIRDPPTMARIARAISNGKADVWDWVTAWFVSSLVSNPASWKANILSNAANAIYDQHMRRLAEAIVNSVVRDKNSASWHELASFYRAFLPGFMDAGRNMWRSWRTGVPTFESSLYPSTSPTAGDKYESKYPTIPILSDVGTKMLLAHDEWFKTIIATQEATALALRQAKAEGVEGDDALTARIAEILKDPESAVWEQSIFVAKRILFQDENPIADLALRLRQGIDDIFGRVPIIPEAALEAVGIHGIGTISLPPLGSFVFPFVKVAANIGTTAFRHLTEPIVAMGHAARGDWKEKPNLVRDLAGAGIGLALWATALSLAYHDDDEGRPLITGTGDAKDEGLEERAGLAPYTVVLFGKRREYKRIEPFATSIGVVVDLGRALRRALNSKDESAIAAASEALMSSVAKQATDKTFLQGFSELVELIEGSIAAAGEGEASSQVVRYVRNFATSFVPNILKLPGREFLIPERRLDSVRKYEGKSRWQSAFSWPALAYQSLPLPANAPPIRYDVWGRPIAQSTSLAHFFAPLPEPEGTPSVQDLDLLVYRYNERVRRGDFDGEGGKVFFPRTPDYTYNVHKEKHWMTDEQYSEVLRLSGEYAVATLAHKRLDFKNPSAKDIDIIDDALAGARAKARKVVLGRKKE